MEYPYPPRARGSFAKAVRTLNELSRLKKKHGIKLTTGFTMTDENYNYAPIVQKMAYRLGSDFSFRPINFSQHYYMNSPEKETLTPDLTLPYLDYVAINLKKEKGMLGCITNLAYIQGAKEFITGNRTLSCSAANESIYIDTVGDVYPCLIMDHKLGNIYKNNQKDIFQSPSAHEARRIIQDLQCPNCWLECEVYGEISKEKKRLVDAFMYGLTLSS